MFTIRTGIGAWTGDSRTVLTSDDRFLNYNAATFHRVASPLTTGRPQGGAVMTSRDRSGYVPVTPSVVCLYPSSDAARCGTERRRRRGGGAIIPGINTGDLLAPAEIGGDSRGGAGAARTLHRPARDRPADTCHVSRATHGDPRLARHVPSHGLGPVIAVTGPLARGGKLWTDVGHNGAYTDF